ncbi:MAG: metallophosphoesterase [Erysipelotrichaceae bacterium]|nr:metallophosphoesterase [Erysipelotrichaceae bacterium]
MEHTITTTYELPFDRDMRIVLLSDLHQRDPEPAIMLTKELRPDIICVAGDTFERYDRHLHPLYKTPAAIILMVLSKTLDYLTNYPREHPPVNNAYALLEGLSTIAPVFLSLGNHESYLKEEDLDIINKYHITLLDNTYVRYDDIVIGGLSTHINKKFIKKFKKQSGIKILLCHHPEYYDQYHLEDIDLILSGHTHGGQIRFFKHGFFASGQGVFPKYSKGLYHNHMIVSAGLANTVSFPRLNNPCEVVLIDLKKVKK